MLFINNFLKFKQMILGDFYDKISSSRATGLVGTKMLETIDRKTSSSMS